MTREPDLFGEVLADIADGPTVSQQGGITEALMRRLHEKGMSLSEMGGAKIMARSDGTMKRHARDLNLAFDDYIPRALKAKHIPARKRELKKDALAYYRLVVGVNPDHLLLMRMGDFYEAFDESAVQLSADLGLILTKRKDTPMCGVPCHAIEDYLKALAHKGRRVAIVEVR